MCGLRKGSFPMFPDSACYRSSAILQSLIVNRGYLDITNLTVCVGDPISAPILGEVSVADGEVARDVTFDDPANANYQETLSVPYTPQLTFDPPLPDRILGPGVYTFTAQLRAISSFVCSSVSSNLDLVTLTVSACTNTAVSLIDIDFGADIGAPKTGFAAIGQTPADIWNPSTPLGRRSAAWPQLLAADGSSTAVGLIVSNAPATWGNGSDDPMYNSFISADPNETATLTVTNLPPGAWNLYLYGHDATFGVTVGTDDYGLSTNQDWPSSGLLI